MFFDRFNYKKLVNLRTSLMIIDDRRRILQEGSRMTLMMDSVATTLQLYLLCWVKTDEAFSLLVITVAQLSLSIRGAMCLLRGRRLLRILLRVLVLLVLLYLFVLLTGTHTGQVRRRRRVLGHFELFLFIFIFVRHSHSTHCMHRIAQSN